MVRGYVFNDASIYSHGKNFSENLSSIKNTGNNLTMKQMFNMSEKLIVGQSDEICGVNTINWDGEEILRQLAFHQEHKRSHNETDVRHI